MTKKITVTNEEYGELKSRILTLELEKESARLREGSMLNRITEQSQQIASFSSKLNKEKRDRLEQCYELAIEMNDPMAAAQIAIML